MAKEHLEVIEHGDDTIAVQYESPTFIKRVFANLLDIIFLFLAFISVFIGVQAIVRVTPFYKTADNVVATYRRDSGLFEYSSKRNTWENISTWLDNNDDTSYDYRVSRCQTAIDDFLTYVNNNYNSRYADLKSDYDKSRLSSKMIDSKKVPLFVETVDGIIHNPESTANSYYYYTKFYREYTLTNCGGFMITIIPEYRVALQQMSNALFYIQIPVSALVSGFLIYLLPGLIFRRGRPTFGKKLMQIGLVDSNILSPSVGRYIARWAIFFFGEVVLSFFTFGLPFIISFSMMVFSKKKQGFPDYMLGLTEVDTNKQKIYFNKYEIAIENTKMYGDPVDFKPEQDD